MPNLVGVVVVLALAAVVALFIFAASVDPLKGRAFRKESLRAALEKVRRALNRF